MSKLRLRDAYAELCWIKEKTKEENIKYLTKAFYFGMSIDTEGDEQIDTTFFIRVENKSGFSKTTQIRPVKYRMKAIPDVKDLEGANMWLNRQVR